MFIIQLLTNGTGQITREGLLNVAAFIIALMIALILHELAHGLTAYAFGDDTAKVNGRLSLNPARHFNWVGFLMLIVVGFGFANPVPVNTNNFKNKKAGMIVVSIAGVLTNLLLGFFFALFLLLVVMNGNGMNQYAYHFLKQLMELTLVLNINFALFNILPIFPLDGYRLLSCFVPQDNGFMRFMRKYSFIILLVLMVWNIFPIIDKYSPLYWYIGKFGSLIANGFIDFWRLIL